MPARLLQVWGYAVTEIFSILEHFVESLFKHDLHLCSGKGVTVCQTCDVGYYADLSGNAMCKVCGGWVTSIKYVASIFISLSLYLSHVPLEDIPTRPLLVHVGRVHRAPTRDCRLNHFVWPAWRDNTRLRMDRFIVQVKPIQIINWFECKYKKFIFCRSICSETACDSGSFTNSSSMTACALCLPGSHAGQKSTICLACTAGRYANRNGIGGIIIFMLENYVCLVISLCWFLIICFYLTRWMCCLWNWHIFGIRYLWSVWR